MTKAFMNVREHYPLYDTVGIFDNSNQNLQLPSGWVTNYAALGGLNEVNFFNVRNKQAGVAYNNLDSRDNFSFAYKIHSIGVQFWANSFTQAPTWSADGTSFSPEDISGHMFCVDLPRHCGLTLRVQQDDRLKAPVTFCPAGYGPYGSGYGRGAPDTLDSLTAPNGYNHTFGVVSSGIPDNSARWPFPKPIEVPRNATLNIKLQFNQYGREMLGAMTYANELFGINDGVTDIVAKPVFAGIRVLLGGERYVQQRGQPHA